MSHQILHAPATSIYYYYQKLVSNFVNTGPGFYSPRVLGIELPGTHWFSEAGWHIRFCSRHTAEI